MNNCSVIRRSSVIRSLIFIRYNQRIEDCRVSVSYVASKYKNCWRFWVQMFTRPADKVTHLLWLLSRMERFRLSSHSSSSKDALVVGHCSKHCWFVCSSSTWSAVCSDVEASLSSKTTPVHQSILVLTTCSSRILQWSVSLQLNQNQYSTFNWQWLRIRVDVPVAHWLQPCPCSPMVKPLGRHVQ